MYRTLVREHSATGLAARLKWAAAGGLAGSVAIGIPMSMSGALARTVAALAGSDELYVGWIVHLAAGLLFALPIAWLVDSPPLRRGIGWGAGYGAFVGTVFAWTALMLVLGRPLVQPLPALVDVALHVLWGGILGAVYAWGLERTEGVVRPRRRLLTRKA